MVPVPTVFLAAVALALLFPEETLALIRRARQWLEDDIRRRVRECVSAKEWPALRAQLDREFDD